MGQDGSDRPEEIPRGPERAAQGTRRARRMVRRTQAQLRGIMGAGQGRLREKLRSAEAILRQGNEGTLDRRDIGQAIAPRNILTDPYSSEIIRNEGGAEKNE